MKDKMPSPLSKDMTISDTTKTMQVFISFYKNSVIFFFLFNNLCKLVILRNLLESLLRDGKSITEGILCPASRLKFGQQCPESEHSLKYWAWTTSSITDSAPVNLNWIFNSQIYIYIHFFLNSFFGIGYYFTTLECSEKNTVKHV